MATVSKMRILLIMIVLAGGVLAHDQPPLDISRMATDTEYANRVRARPENGSDYLILKTYLDRDISQEALRTLDQVGKRELVAAMHLASQYYNNGFVGSALRWEDIRKSLLFLILSDDGYTYTHAILAYANLTPLGGVKNLIDAVNLDPLYSNPKARALISALVIMCDPDRVGLLKEIRRGAISEELRGAAEAALNAIERADSVGRCSER